MHDFMEMLAIQRWDDHRYYHHSRVNQALHLLSAMTFLCAYGLLFINPVAASLLGWIVAMGSRQMGHFFFEPRGYDSVNQATHEYKEAIKVGYNLHRKVILIMLWAFCPLIPLISPDLFGMVDVLGLESSGFIDKTALIWLALGFGGLLFRTLHLFILQTPMTGLVWMSKILTDPFHDILLYHRAPIYLLRGEWIDPMMHATNLRDSCSEQHA